MGIAITDRGADTMSFKDYDTGHKNTWCPGCGDFGILHAVRLALDKQGLPKEQVLVVSGIGCSGKIPHYIHTYGIEAIHGRALPAATGARFANPSLKIIAHMGDGDCYGIGMGHFIHAMRRNLDITAIVHDNMIYGLTKGQTSPTSEEGFVTKSTPHGAIEQPVNPIALALASGATFIARGFSGEALHLAELIEQGMQHKGFALIDVFQPCVTYNMVNTYGFFQKKTYRLDQEGHDNTDFEAAMRKAHETERLPIGLFYHAKHHTYVEKLKQEEGDLIVHEDISNIDVEDLLDAYE